MTDADFNRDSARGPAQEVARSTPRHTLVGRERELASLDRAFDSAVSGSGCIVGISGEPGIGKTRLTEELAARAVARGAIVGSGHCVQADGAPPYWPWAECSRVLNRTRPLKELVLPASMTERLSALLPELSDSLPPSQRSVPATTVLDRFHLFDAVRTLLERASSVGPVVLILEDMHHADPSSLLLLEFLARELRESRLLILVTYREDELSPRLHQTLGELARVGLRSLRLTGLTCEGTRALMAQLSVGPCSEDVAQLIHVRTAGNPFFVTELAQLKPLEAGAVPENVRSAVRARVSRLADVTRRLLVVASVMGREFDFRLVGDVLAAAGEPEPLHALDEALERLFIDPILTRGESWYQFRHALIRDALYDSVSPSRRANWHAAIVEQLDRRPGVLGDDRASDLAYHAAQAETLIGASRVSRYARLAGERMLGAHAFGEALPQFARAWRTRSGMPLDDDGAAILAGLGYAQAATTVRWNREEAWSHLRRALEHYLRSGDIQKAVAMATHASLPAEGVSGVAEVIAPLLRIVPDGSREAGALISRQAAARYFEDGDHAGAHRGFTRALSIASRHQDLALELRVHAQATSVDHFALRWHDVLTRSGQVLVLARRVDDLHSETYARYRAAFVLLHFGRVEEARVEAGHNLAAAERLRRSRAARRRAVCDGADRTAYGPLERSAGEQRQGLGARARASASTPRPRRPGVRDGERSVRRVVPAAPGRRRPRSAPLSAGRRVHGARTGTDRQRDRRSVWARCGGRRRTHGPRAIRVPSRTPSSARGWRAASSLSWTANASRASRNSRHWSRCFPPSR